MFAVQVDMSTIAAWWGAIIATIVLAWDVYKWTTTGLKLKFRVSPNMEIAGNPDANAGLLISLSVSNVGDRATTITHVFGVEFKNHWQRLRKKRLKVFVVPQPGGNPLPYVLPPGATYLGLISQREAEVAIEHGHIMYVGFHHSMADKPIVQRLMIEPIKAATHD